MKLDDFKKLTTFQWAFVWFFIFTMIRFIIKWTNC